MVNVHIRIWESFFHLLEFENLFSVPILFHVKSEPISKSETVIEFITPPPTIPSRATTPFPPRDQLQSRLVKEQECASEQPYRLKLHSQSVDLRLDPVARDLIALKACDHHVADVVNVLPRPPRSASIPSKCRWAGKLPLCIALWSFVRILWQAFVW